jgi:hypothetical protein
MFDCRLSSESLKTIRRGFAKKKKPSPCKSGKKGQGRMSADKCAPKDKPCLSEEYKKLKMECCKLKQECSKLKSAVGEQSAQHTRKLLQIYLESIVVMLSLARANVLWYSLKIGSILQQI